MNSGEDLESMASEFLMASKRCGIASLESLLEMGMLVAATSDLIHALQRERGASNLFLGSRGVDFGERLSELALETDTALANLTPVLRKMAGGRSMCGERTLLFNRLARATHSLAGLDALRRKVRDARMDLQEGVEAYNELVRVLLSIVFEAADSAVDPMISRILVALFNFMEGKEYAGQERATGAGAFAMGRIDDAVRDRILGLIGEQERCFGHFENFADDDSLAEWRALLIDPNQAALEKLRRIACTAGAGGVLDVSLSREWFERTTRRIDGMKRIEERLSLRLRELCEEKLEESQAASVDMRSEVGAALDRESDVGQGYVLFCGGGRSSPVPIGDSRGPKLGRALVEMLHAQERKLQLLSDEIARARSALEDRKVIEKAKGMLMARRHLSEQDAYKTLRDLAMRQNCRIAELAERMVSVESLWE